MKNEKTNLIIWAVVALVIGIVIGTFLIAPIASGSARSVLCNCNQDPDSVAKAQAFDKIAGYVNTISPEYIANNPDAVYDTLCRTIVFPSGRVKTPGQMEHPGM